VARELLKYKLIFRNEELKIRSSFNELGDKAIHPNECMLFSENQYKRRDEINAKGSFFNVVPYGLLLGMKQSIYRLHIATTVIQKIILIVFTLPQTLMDVLREIH